MPAFFNKSAYSLPWSLIGSNPAVAIMVGGKLLKSCWYNGLAQRWSILWPFGKTVFPVEFGKKGVFYFGYVTPVLHYCMGGLQIKISLPF